MINVLQSITGGYLKQVRQSLKRPLILATAGLLSFGLADGQVIPQRATTDGFLTESTSIQRVLINAVDGYLTFGFESVTVPPIQSGGGGSFQFTPKRRSFRDLSESIETCILRFDKGKVFDERHHGTKVTPKLVGLKPGRLSFQFDRESTLRITRANIRTGQIEDRSDRVNSVSKNSFSITTGSIFSTQDYFDNQIATAFLNLSLSEILAKFEGLTIIADPHSWKAVSGSRVTSIIATTPQTVQVALSQRRRQVVISDKDYREAIKFARKLGPELIAMMEADDAAV